VAATLNHICASFRADLRRDPSLDLPGNRALSIQRQVRGYNSQDGSVKHQKCLTLQVFQSIYNNTFTHKERVLGELICGALFFGMRSCEYSVVKGERKTKLLVLRNIQFFLNNQKVARIRRNMQLLEALSISITFVSKKNGVKDQTITMHKNGTKLYLVRIWACLTLRILQYPGGSLDLPVNIFNIKHKMTLISSQEILEHIRATVSVMGSENLGFHPKEVGCHSIRSSFAMFLYLQDMRTDRIMLQGRWKSDAFLLYIRVQVAAFSKGLSSALIHDSNQFFTTPDTHSSNNMGRTPMFNFDIIMDPADPRCRNANSFASNLNNNGPGANNRRVTRPSFFHIYA